MILDARRVPLPEDLTGLPAVCDVFGTSGRPLELFTLEWAARHIASTDDQLALILHAEQLRQLKDDVGRRIDGGLRWTRAGTGWPAIRGRVDLGIPALIWACAAIRPCNGGADWFGWMVPMSSPPSDDSTLAELQPARACGIVSRRSVPGEKPPVP